ncbi:MAG: Hsp33 family molecular chaperone [Rhizobiaceae bacterium]
MSDKNKLPLAPAQDLVIPFQVEPLDVRGRAVQLGPMLNTILDRHNYPQPVARLLAEAITLTVLLGTTLKFDGKFILQTQTDGPVSMIVTDFRAPDSIRAYARYDKQAIEKAMQAEATDAPSLLGNGILAMTLDQGKHTQRYQGIVQLDGIGLEEVARLYFAQSEQIPTEIRLAVGEILIRQEGMEPLHAWTAGGVMLQFFPDNEDRMRQKDLHGGDGDPDKTEPQIDDAWLEARSLMKTIADVELTDVNLEPERLLYRLFHDHGVRAFEAIPVLDNCACSHEKVENMLAGLSVEEREQSIEKDSSGQPKILVTCEFCNQDYQFDPDIWN